MATLMQSAAYKRSSTSSRVAAVGRELARYGLVVVVAGIGLPRQRPYLPGPSRHSAWQFWGSPWSLSTHCVESAAISVGLCRRPS